MTYTAGFIGVGNMGGTLAKAACTEHSKEILVSSIPYSHACERAEEFGCAPAENTQIAKECRYIFLGVKPKDMSSMLSGIETELAARKDRFVLVSMAAGVTVETIRRYAGGDYPVIRIMPNLACAVGEAVIPFHTEDVTEEEIAEFRELMKHAGWFDLVEEKMIDLAGTVSGCGPAWFAMMVEGLADGAVLCGVPRKKAYDYAIQTMIGTGRYMQESGMHPGELKDAVCSPGGTTIEGVRVLEDSGFRSAVMNAVIAACKKNLK